VGGYRRDVVCTVLGEFGAQRQTKRCGPRDEAWARTVGRDVYIGALRLQDAGALLLEAEVRSLARMLRLDEEAVMRRIEALGGRWPPPGATSPA